MLFSYTRRSAVAGSNDVGLRLSCNAIADVSAHKPAKLVSGLAALPAHLLLHLKINGLDWKSQISLATG